MTEFADPPTWTGASGDPNDEQFGDVVVPATVDDLGDLAAVLVGEPFDAGVIGRPGARRGPAATRRELAGVKSHHFGSGPVQSVGDLGDVELPEDVDLGSRGDSPDGGAQRRGEEGSRPRDDRAGSPDVAAVQEAVAGAADRVYESDAVPVFLGGDNSLTYGNAAPLLDRGSVGAISFDAHLDCREVRGGPTSGTPYRQLLEAGLDRLVVAGARHFETSTEYVEYASEREVTVLTAGNVRANATDLATTLLQAMSGLDAVYVSVDLDVLGDAHAPGVSAPTPGGITPRELFGVVRRLLSDPIVAGFEVVECAPPLDRDGRTARVGARTVAHALAGLTGAEGNAPGVTAVREGPHE